MNKIKNLFLLLTELSGGRWGITVISAVFPILVMVGFGVFLAIKYDYILVLSVTIALSTLAISLPLFLLSRSVHKSATSDKYKPITEDQQLADDFVKAAADWSQNEVLIWQKSKINSRHLLNQNSDWNQLDQVGLEVMGFVAEAFGKKALDFSIPEGLQLLEEISRRYKLVIRQYIPAIEMLKVSYLKAGYSAYDKYGAVGEKAIKIAIWANHAKNLYINPAKFATDFIKEQSTSGMTKGLVENMQVKAKQALLDEIASVAIDLYSGRFSFEEDQVTASAISDQDLLKMAPPLEPIRIVVIGQTSVGKSSIINVLKNELVAEVDVLPSTDRKTVYAAMLDEIEIRIVDLQGLDGDQKTQQLMLAEMTDADLVIWVLKANQPARELDKTLKTKFDDYYLHVKHISRKKAAVICIVNQVDKLKPITEWQPPYDLNQATSAKAKIINQALAYNAKILMPDHILALSIDPDKQSFGIEHLKQTIRQEIANANNVQRNRQRLEAKGRGITIKKQFQRVINSGKSITPKLLKTAAPNLSKLTIKKLKKDE